MNMNTIKQNTMVQRQRRNQIRPATKIAKTTMTTTSIVDSIGLLANFTGATTEKQAEAALTPGSMPTVPLTTIFDPFMDGLGANEDLSATAPNLFGLPELAPSPDASPAETMPMLLSMVEQIVDCNEVSFDPTPIGPGGIKEVVEQIDLSQSFLDTDMALAECLSPLLIPSNGFDDSALVSMSMFDTIAFARNNVVSDINGKRKREHDAPASHNTRCYEDNCNSSTGQGNSLIYGTDSALSPHSQIAVSKRTRRCNDKVFESPKMNSISPMVKAESRAISSNVSCSSQDISDSSSLFSTMSPAIGAHHLICSQVPPPLSSSAPNVPSIGSTSASVSVSCDEVQGEGDVNRRPTIKTGGKGATKEDPSKDVTFRQYQADLWCDRFQELLNFRMEQGHCLVPHAWGPNPALAQWVKRQRYQRKLKREGKRTTMTDERECALERLNFVWDSHAAIWEERLNALTIYKQNQGDCNVPCNYEHDQALAIWVKCQRRQYKLFKCGKRSTLTKERLEKLNRLDFAWNPRKLNTYCHRSKR